MLVLLAGCTSSEGWTVERAEEVTNVRGLTVRVLQCRGLGRERDGRYERFACRAGARAPGEETETVAVLYELHVRNSHYELRNVTFSAGRGSRS
jgi:hypothetical protein